MSFTSIRQYFIDRMSTVDSDLREWEDAFNVENIPSNLLDKSWHMTLSPFSYTGSAHTCLGFNSAVLIRVYFKGYREPREAVDTALEYAETIIKECTKPTNRLSQPNIKNVLPGTINVRELATTNDNVVILEIQFSVTNYI